MILGYSSIGIKKIEQIDRPKGKLYFERINASGKRLLKLLEDLIDSAKSENLEIKYYSENFNLIELLRIAVAEISYKTRENGVSIVMEYDENEHSFDHLSISLFISLASAIFSSRRVSLLLFAS